MKIKFEKEKLLGALQNTSKFQKGNSVIPIMNHFLFEPFGDKGIQITGADVNKRIEQIIEFESAEEFTSSFTLPIKELLTIVSKIGKEITFEQTDKTIIIKSGRAKFTLTSLDVETYPKSVAIKADTTFKVDGEVFSDNLKKASVMCSTDTDTAMSGICLDVKKDKIKYIATNGSRLIIIENEYQCEEELNIVLPSETAKGLSGLMKGEVIINLNETTMELLGENIKCVTNLINKQYPAYEGIIPKKSDEDLFAVVEVKKLKQSLDIVSVAFDNEAPVIKSTFENNKLTMESVNKDIGKALDEIEIEYNGDKLTLQLNPKYLIDLFPIVTDENININFKDEVAAVKITSSNICYIIMPIKNVT